ncbi:hypothetical protein DM860_013729 [Cuscuta australis]|uniref:Uncharacterized protein n=1 Tax=Cuscuta australis TaxID=267555 RepID=A0A328EEN3_9ASTE|nr:hypothetical protein DM860_013729 [Cuscuta australis]
MAYDVEHRWFLKALHQNDSFLFRSMYLCSHLLNVILDFPLSKHHTSSILPYRSQGVASFTTDIANGSAVLRLQYHFTHCLSHKRRKRLRLIEAIEGTGLAIPLPATSTSIELQVFFLQRGGNI